MKKKILVVDDELTICELLKYFLTPQYEVVTTCSGLEALTWLESNIPDLIISDIQMTKMNGFEFLKEMRLMGYMKHTPIIMLSGRTESKERVKCYRLGAQDYLTKPFNPEELEELVKKNLNPLYYTSLW